MKVLKFGGSSLGNAENIEKVIAVIENAAKDDKCFVILSAMGGVTDALIETGSLAEKGNVEFQIN